jgi:hypothetical protein
MVICALRQLVCLQQSAHLGRVEHKGIASMPHVFEVRGNVAVANENAAGPWDPGMQHGSAPSSLIAWWVERMETRVPMQVARMTVDLLRPVPIAPLEIKTEIVREGRKIQIIEVRLLHGETEVVRASVLKIRSDSIALPSEAEGPAIDLPGPEKGTKPDRAGEKTNPFLSGLEMSVVKGGGFGYPGPASVWFRGQRPIIAGDGISALMRATIASDFCNGVSSVLDFRKWSFINADLTVSLSRMPVGEWVLLDAESWLGDTGSGIAFARLGDSKGYFARAIQSLVIEKR